MASTSQLASLLFTYMVLLFPTCKFGGLDIELFIVIVVKVPSAAIQRNEMYIFSILIINFADNVNPDTCVGTHFIYSCKTFHNLNLTLSGIFARL